MSEMQLAAWGFKAFVLKESFVPPIPVLTKFLPGHDHRTLSKAGEPTRIPIELYFSAEMDCQSLTQGIQIVSTTQDKRQARVDEGSVGCDALPVPETPSLTGVEPGVWSFAATLVDVSDGIHMLTIRNASARGGTAFTNVSSSPCLAMSTSDHVLTLR